MNAESSQRNKTPWYGIPWLVILFYFLVVLASLPLALRVEKDFSTRRFVPQNDPDLAYNKEIVAEFGGDELVVIGIEAPDIFIPRILQLVEDLTMAMESRPGVTRVVSLSTVNKLEGDQGFLDSDLLMPFVPLEEEDIEAVREVALENSLILGEVVSADGTATAINVFFDPDLLPPDYVKDITRYVDEVIAEVKKGLPETVEIYAVGTPQMLNAFRVSMESDLQRLVPVAVALIALVLLIIFRSLLFALIPVITGLASIIPTVAFMSLAGFSLDPITSIVPLLLLVMGSTEDTHLLAEYRRSRRNGVPREGAIVKMFDHAGTAILLTSLTTALGFASLTISDLPALRDFGIVSAFGIILNFLVTIHLLPAVLRIMPAHWHAPEEGDSDRAADVSENPVSRKVQSIAVNHRRVVIGVGVGAVLFFLGGAQRVNVNTDFLRILHPENEVRSAFDRLQENLSGGSFFRVVVEAPGPGDMLRPSYLKELDRIDRYLANRFDKTLSFAQFIRKIHVEMNDGDPGFNEIPDDNELIAQYTLLLDQDELFRVLDFDHRRASIIVRSAAGNSAYLRKETEALEAFVEREISPAIEVVMTGRLLQMANSAEKITTGIRINIAIMLLVILVTISGLFLSLKAGLLSLLPNLFPVLAVFGIMGWMELPLSIFTFSVAVIGLGIAVDDTIHFLSRYHQQLRKADTPEKAMRQTIAAEFLPIASTSLALTGGFLILTTSSFATTAEFGFLSAVSIFAAFLGDILFAPSLLLKTPIVSSWTFLRMKFNVERAMDRGIFKGMGKNDIKRIAVMAQILDFRAGETVLRKGETGRDIFWIMEGQADVFPDGQAGGSPVASYREGELIGEMAFLQDAPRTADVVANGPLRLLKIDDHILDRITEKFPRTATRLYRNIAHMLVKRLRTRTAELMKDLPSSRSR